MTTATAPNPPGPSRIIARDTLPTGPNTTPRSRAILITTSDVRWVAPSHYGWSAPFTRTPFAAPHPLYRVFTSNVRPYIANICFWNRLGQRTIDLERWTRQNESGQNEDVIVVSIGARYGTEWGRAIGEVIDWIDRATIGLNWGVEIVD